MHNRAITSLEIFVQGFSIMPEDGKFVHKLLLANVEEKNVTMNAYLKYNPTNITRMKRKEWKL